MQKIGSCGPQDHLLSRMYCPYPFSRFIGTYARWHSVIKGTNKDTRVNPGYTARFIGDKVWLYVDIIGLSWWLGSWIEVPRHSHPTSWPDQISRRTVTHSKCCNLTIKLISLIRKHSTYVSITHHHLLPFRSLSIPSPSAITFSSYHPNLDGCCNEAATKPGLYHQWKKRPLVDVDVSAGSSLPSLVFAEQGPGFSVEYTARVAEYYTTHAWTLTYQALQFKGSDNYVSISLESMVLLSHPFNSNIFISLPLLQFNGFDKSASPLTRKMPDFLI